MSDLIRRSDVLELAKAGKLVSNGNYKSVVASINSIPSAEPTIEQNIVRCKDCKHYNPYEDQREYDCLTGMCGVMKDDYCSFGERREP